MSEFPFVLIARPLVLIKVDGQASNIRIVQSSGFPLLDEAALAAARHAEYPSPPPELRGQTQHLSGWVEDEPKGAE